jgi:uncharacterized cupredoxin-like copper-binding protein
MTVQSRIAVLVVAAGASLAACSNAGTASPTTAPAGTSPASVQATETEFKIDLSAVKAAPGPVAFHVKNGGTIVHEFVVMRTDLAADKLPMASGAPEVNEDAPGLTAVDEIEDIAVGASADLSVTLQAGHYVVLCNLPGHYAGGMHADFTVGG